MTQHDTTKTAELLVRARASRRALTGFPGEIPPTVDEAYTIQDEVIALTDDTVVGWKVGLIAPALRERAGAERLVGPVFATNLWPAQPGVVMPLPAIVGGTSCVEAEIVMTVGVDVPAGTAVQTLDDARQLLGGVHVAVELAGSPVPQINGLGPMAVASDLGNNAGLVLGPQVPEWRSGAWEQLEASTWIAGELVGRADATSIAGGALEAFRFALATVSGRGLDIPAGTHIATGAVTGIHDVVPGQHARIRFGEIFQVDLDVVEA